LAGALGATLFPLLVGVVLDHFKALGHINAGYNILFVICGSAYLVAWVVMRVIRSSNQTVDIAQLSPKAST
jgi:ACS family hexuronate transporter-like MFS transporter